MNLPQPDKLSLEVNERPKILIPEYANYKVSEKFVTRMVTDPSSSFWTFDDDLPWSASFVSQVGSIARLQDNPSLRNIRFPTEEERVKARKKKERQRKWIIVLIVLSIPFIVAMIGSSRRRR